VTHQLDVGSGPLTIEQVLEVARGSVTPRLPRDPAWERRIDRGVQSIADKLRAGGTIYGVSTGVGDSCETPVPAELAATLQSNLIRFHGCGTGRVLSEFESAAVVVVRLASLSRGWSAVRRDVLQRLCDLLAHRILPCIPSQGSVGASGDLTPLSYLAAALVGEREVYHRGRRVEARSALAEARLEPLRLEAKEALSLMNGTSVMTALGCIAFEQSMRLARLAASLTAMASDVTRGNQAHFDGRLFAAKPHPGQRACARWIAEDIAYDARAPRAVGRVQDRYSIRCAPHVIGVLLDAAPFLRSMLEIELNGADDNPLVDPESGDVLHGGNFYGGHVCLSMDLLKNTVANLADLLDRQMALICNPAMNGGELPANLVLREGPDRAAHHGFKAMQISTSALAAEALKLTMPASAFSRSTECHNQDKVSMGTIAARDCLAIIDLTETVATIHLLALCQAFDIREGADCGPRSRALHAAVRSRVPVNRADRRMDLDIAEVLAALRDDALPVGKVDLQ
jgi:histidine ammonia-lyase